MKAFEGGLPPPLTLSRAMVMKVMVMVASATTRRF